jgi:hypothetical protein
MLLCDYGYLLFDWHRGFGAGPKSCEKAPLRFSGMTGIGYTYVRIFLSPLFVADCSRAGIGYTSVFVAGLVQAVADCSRAGIGYTRRVRRHPS